MLDASEADGTRTRDHWIDSPAGEIRNFLCGSGLERHTGRVCTVGCTDFLTVAAASEPAAAPANVLGDQDLQRVIAAWPHLPSHIRLAILALVAAVEPPCAPSPCIDPPGV